MYLYVITLYMQYTCTCVCVSYICNIYYTTGLTTQYLRLDLDTSSIYISHTPYWSVYWNIIRYLTKVFSIHEDMKFAFGSYSNTHRLAGSEVIQSRKTWNHPPSPTPPLSVMIYGLMFNDPVIRTSTITIQHIRHRIFWFSSYSNTL